MRKKSGRQKEEYFLLKDAARRGDVQASLAFAERLFRGSDGVSCNYKLGFAYLQQLLNSASSSASVLVAELVPLQYLMEQNCRGALGTAVRAGSQRAEEKLWLWNLLEQGELAHDTRSWNHVEITNVQKTGRGNPEELARLLLHYQREGALDAVGVMLIATRAALRQADIKVASEFLCTIEKMTQSSGIDRQVAEMVIMTVGLAAKQCMPLNLPVHFVEASLEVECRRGSTEAQYILGRALAGLDYDSLPADALTGGRNVKRAIALLLRAADAGVSQAWLELFRMTSGYRSSFANQDAARFFLEKSALAGVATAQRVLGAMLLKEATTLEAAELGVHWLAKAAKSADTVAIGLLATLVIPIPELPVEMEETILANACACEGQLAARLRLARMFHLTRREAFNFDAVRDVREWGLVVPGTYAENPRGRLAPAIDAPMKLELATIAELSARDQSGERQNPVGLLRAQKQLFRSLDIDECQFFPAEIGRTWSHYGFGKHWAAHVSQTSAQEVTW